MAAQEEAMQSMAQPTITVPALPPEKRPEFNLTVERGGAQGPPAAREPGPKRVEPIPPDLPGIAERSPVATGGALVVLTVAIAVAGWYLPAGTNWLVVLALIAAFFLITGKAITGRALGVFINERKLMSLSRFQLVVWTGLIVSGFFVIALERIHSAVAAQPLAIGIDWQIWALLGISTASFVGTPLLNTNKKSKEPRKSELVKKTATRFNEHEDEVDRNREGILYGNSSVAFARFTDMFQGDELANAQLVDVAKLQLFFFTIVVAIAYGTQLFQLIAYGDLDLPGVRLPVLQDGLLALMGVSHAGYLGAKGIDQTPTA
jgi:hypothetical protein